MDLQCFSSIAASRMAVLLFMLQVLLVLMIPAAGSGESEGDRDALWAFKNATARDDNNCIGSWDKTLLTACGWKHIRCGTSDRDKDRVTAIDLQGCYIAGPLVPELGNLTMLMRMNLSSNDLIGTILPELGKLINLEYLAMDDNFFDGQIPKELVKLRKLKTLLLQENLLNGTVPEVLSSNFTRMTLVNLTRNSWNLAGPNCSVAVACCYGHSC